MHENRRQQLADINARVDELQAAITAMRYDLHTKKIMLEELQRERFHVIKSGVEAGEFREYTIVA